MTYIQIDDFIKIVSYGDLIFGRSDSLFGKIIRISGNCMWNHVSMCIINNDQKYWCESVRNSNYHYNSNEEYNGVRMNEIKRYINYLFSKTNDKRLFIGISKFNNTNNNDNNVNDRLREFYNRENGKPYTNSYFKLFLSWFDGFPSISNLICHSRQNEEYNNENQSEWTIYRGDGKSYFCSELVIQSLLDSSIMNKSFMKNTNIEIPSGEWTVSNVADTNYLNTHLKDGYKYSPIVHYIIIP